MNTENIGDMDIKEKTTRVYFSTFIDVPLNSNDFSNDEAMVQYAEDNVGDFVTIQDIMDNLSVEENKSQIVDL